MSRGFYRVVFCAFLIGKNGGTLNVMVRACTRYIGDLGKSRQATIPKAWHAHGNIPYMIGHFYPELAEVGKEEHEEEEPGRTAFLHSVGASVSARGSVTVKVVPTPRVLSTWMVP